MLMFTFTPANAAPVIPNTPAATSPAKTLRFMFSCSPFCATSGAEGAAYVLLARDGAEGAACARDALVRNLSCQAVAACVLRGLRGLACVREGACVLSSQEAVAAYHGEPVRRHGCA